MGAVKNARSRARRNAYDEARGIRPRFQRYSAHLEAHYAHTWAVRKGVPHSNKRR